MANVPVTKSIRRVGPYVIRIASRGKKKTVGTSRLSLLCVVDTYIDVASRDVMQQTLVIN